MGNPVFEQSYGNPFCGNPPKNVLKAEFIANPTTPYVDGLFVAMITEPGNPNIGKWTAYDPSLADGSEVLGGIIWDDNISSTSDTETSNIINVIIPGAGLIMLYNFRFKPGITVDVPQVLLDTFNANTLYIGDNFFAVF